MRVAIILPVRNAEALLPDCLAAVTSQTRAADEVFIVVAPSNDGTIALARRLAGPSQVVRDNPAGDRGSAINIALTESRSDVIAMVDDRSRLAPDYLETALIALERHAADVVGGPMRPHGRSAIGRAMAMALQSSFGIGDSQFHFAGKARKAESVYLGVYRRSVFAAVGRYSPVLQRTEDDDMNARIREAGLQIWLDPAIRSTYLCRGSFGAIWRQYHGYGYWKVGLAAARPRAIRLRHLIPAGFVLALVAAAVISFAWWPPALPLLFASYFLTGWVAALLAPRCGVVERLLFPFITLTMHLAYGTGTLTALLAWPHLRSLVRRGAGR